VRPDEGLLYFKLSEVRPDEGLLYFKLREVRPDEGLLYFKSPFLNIHNSHFYLCVPGFVSSSQIRFSEIRTKMRPVTRTLHSLKGNRRKKS